MRDFAPRTSAEVEAERIDRLFADIGDSVVRYRKLVELLFDYAEAVRAETVDDLIHNPRD